MRVVNVQLREQAEAAIKDKVATMSLDEVLSDKQPIIRELTARLRHVAEGDEGGEGLGLRIVTVQIKEAVVSSATLWETLQRPFRAERAKEARLAELANESVVRKREAEEEQARATEEIETQATIARRRAEEEARAFDREQGERTRRAKLEAESLAATIAHERDRLEKQAELARLRLEQELAERRLRSEAAHREAEQALALESARRKVENEVSPAALQARLVEKLPEIAEKLPKPQELKAISCGADGVGSLVGGLRQLLDSWRA